MERFERDATPERLGDELRALNRGDDGPLTFLHLPEPKSGMTSNASSAADLREVRDNIPIYRPNFAASKQYVSKLPPITSLCTVVTSNVVRRHAETR
jgi:hypothetical protein